MFFLITRYQFAITNAFIYKYIFKKTKANIKINNVLNKWTLRQDLIKDALIGYRVGSRSSGSAGSS